MAPTRIIRPLRVIRNPKTLTGKGAPYVTVADCDDGKTYTVAELAKIIGIMPDTMSTRLKRYGWDNDHIFNPPAKKGNRISGEFIAENVNEGDWQGLSAKVRNGRLSKIKIGKWERKYLFQQQRAEKL